jgi:opacity protein-like surface antigen
LHRVRLLAPLSVLLLLVSARPADADLTAFIGAQSNPSTRMTRGLSAGSGFLIVAFEGEYAQTSSDEVCAAVLDSDCAPSVRTVMFNGLVQTPRGVLPKVQLYGTVGGGYYRVRYEAFDVQDTGFGTNVGGGVKIDLVGPLRVRIDYRIFRLGEERNFDPTEEFDEARTAQRFYVGANLAF